MHRPVTRLALCIMSTRGIYYQDSNILNDNYNVIHYILFNIPPHPL